MLAENRFLAARDGMDARLIDPVARSLVPVRETLDALLAECRPHALALGCADALDRVPWLAAATGADRQRLFLARRGSLEPLVATLAQRFAPVLPDPTAGPTTVNTHDTPTERSGICAAGSHTPVPPSS